RRHQHGIGKRERRHHAAAAEHQPGFVAVPYRRNAVHDDVAVFLLGEEREQDAESEIESVHHHINEHGECNDEGPDRREIDWYAHRIAPVTAPAAGVMPAARAGVSWLGPSSPGCGAAAISRSR